MKNIYDILIEKRRINEDKTVYVGREGFKKSDFIRVFGKLTTETPKFKMLGSLFMADKIEIKDERDASLVRQIINYFNNDEDRLIAVSGDVNISNCNYLDLFLFHEGKKTIKKSKYINILNFSKKRTAKIFIESCFGMKIINSGKDKDIHIDSSESISVSGNFNSLNVNKSRVYIDNDYVETNIKKINATNDSDVSFSTMAKIGKIGKAFSDDTSEIINPHDTTLS